LIKNGHFLEYLGFVVIEGKGLKYWYYSANTCYSHDSAYQLSSPTRNTRVSPIFWWSASGIKEMKVHKIYALSNSISAGACHSLFST
jgi:hypothetical protein